VAAELLTHSPHQNQAQVAQVHEPLSELTWDQQWDASRQLPHLSSFTIIKAGKIRGQENLQA